MIEGRTVAIAGLGLVGGSLARDLAARGARVLGFDQDEGTMLQAVASGCVHRALDASLAGVTEADWLIIAVPVDRAVEVLETIAPRGRQLTLITDVGSTKRRIEAAADRLGLPQFVGSHPLAGGHRSGWSASHAGLFERASVFVCPTTLTRRESLHEARSLWEALGASIIECTSAEHDEHVAWVSHLPQLASSALALSLAGKGKTFDELGPGGRDAVRLAASSPEMWRAIALENAAELTVSLLALERALSDFRAAIGRGDAGELEDMFGRASAWYTSKSTAADQVPGTAIAATTESARSSAVSDRSFNE